MEQIDRLTLVCNLDCNLTCEYCVIQKYKDIQYSHNEQLKNLKAFENGEYLKNILTILKKIEQFPNNITCLEFWGQEPTLTLPTFTKVAEQWFEKFPNIKEIVFSTNGISNPQIIIDFITKIDSIAKRKIDLNLQWSYDGEYATEKIRHVMNNAALNHLYDFIKKLNSVHLDNVNIVLNVHSVLSWNLINSLLEDEEKIKSFWEDKDKILQSLCKININKSICFHCNTQIETPTKHTQEDGFKLYKFFAISLKYVKDYRDIDYDSFRHLRILKQISTYKDLRNGFSEIMASGILNFQNKQYFTKQLSPSISCSPSFRGLSIKYNGDIVFCHTSCLESDINQINIPDNLIQEKIKKNWVQKKLILNGITSPKEDILKMYEFFENNKFEAYWQVFQSVLNKMFFMAQIGQILPSYKDNLDKLIYHAFMISFINGCIFNNAIRTGSFYCKSADIIRLFGNGLCDLIEESVLINEK